MAGFDLSRIAFNIQRLLYIPESCENSSPLPGTRRRATRRTMSAPARQPAGSHPDTRLRAFDQVGGGQAALERRRHSQPVDGETFIHSLQQTFCGLPVIRLQPVGQFSQSGHPFLRVQAPGGSDRRFLLRAAVLSALAEPVGAGIGLLAVAAWAALNGYFMAIAAGARIFASIHELLSVARRYGRGVGLVQQQHLSRLWRQHRASSELPCFHTITIERG